MDEFPDVAAGDSVLRPRPDNSPNNSPNKSQSSALRMARGAFGASLVTFIAPNLVPGWNPGVPRSELTIDMAVAGIVSGILALILALVAKQRFSTEKDKSGSGFATAALCISVLGLVIHLASITMFMARRPVNKTGRRRVQRIENDRGNGIGEPSSASRT